MIDGTATTSQSRDKMISLLSFLFNGATLFVISAVMIPFIVFNNNGKFSSPAMTSWFKGMKWAVAFYGFGVVFLGIPLSLCVSSR
jgi:hypothetical protein